MFNSNEAIQNESDRYKIRHKSLDYAGFSSVIDSSLNGPGTQSPVPGDAPLGQCHTYFREMVALWLPNTDPERHAQALTQAMLQLLQVVDIRLDGHENAHAIFEALNARGEPLTEWEKTKNYLLSIAVWTRRP